MKRMTDKKLPRFIICWIVIIGMVLCSSPAFSRERNSSHDRDSSHESNRSYDNDRSSNNGRSSKSDGSYKSGGSSKNDRYDDRNRSRTVRVVHHDNLVPAIIATGLIAGITFSLLDNDPPAPRTTTSRYCSNVASRAVRTASVTVTAGLLNVRSGPALYNPCIGQISRGAVLTVIGSDSGWYRIRTSAGLTGWVMIQYTSSVVGSSG